MRRALFCAAASATLLATPLHSQERGSKAWIQQMKSFFPLQQSQCEIASNKTVLAHPRTDMFELMKRYRAFPFGPAIPPSPAFTYRDTQSGITFYVESDGRHLAAIDSNGKLLWVRNPFVDSNMCPYRSAHPFIASMGPPGGGVDRKGHVLTDVQANILLAEELTAAIPRGAKWAPPEKGAKFISLTFNSSQSGLVNIRNGDYYFMGQN